MKWDQIIILILVVVFFSICIPAYMGAYWCWSNRKSDGSSKVIVRIGWLLGAISWSYLSTLAATIFGVKGPRPKYTVEYIIIYLQGLIVLSCAINALVMYLQKRDK